MDLSPTTQLIILIVLLILSGFFSSAETALTTVNKHKLRALSEEGKKRAARVLAVTENSGKLLSTILIGNNIVNISASALATTLCTDVFGSKYIGVSTGLLTLFVLIFGEITPKTFATKYAVSLSMIFVYPIWILMIVLTPIVMLLNIITGIIFKLLRVDPNSSEETMTESELRTIVDVSHEDGVIEQSEKFMISNVVDFGDALCKEIMIPRADVVFADVNATYNELVEIFTTETYSRIPIYEDTKDNIIGLLYLKDLFFYNEAHGQASFDVKKILRKPLFVYEYQKTSQIFADMKTSSVTMAVVLDEYGVSSGIITMEDLIEEIVGEIRDEYDQDEANTLKKIGENSYDIEGAMKLTDLNDALGTALFSEHYDSLAGFVIQLLDKLPKEGETAHYSDDDFNISFKVTKFAKNRIERIRLSLKPVEKENAETEE